MVDSTLAREDWLSHHEFGNYTTDGPYIDIGTIVRVSKDKFGGSVVPRADVGDIGFTFDQLLGTSKVTEFQNVRTCIA